MSFLQTSFPNRNHRYADLIRTITKGLHFQAQPLKTPGQCNFKINPFQKAPVLALSKGLSVTSPSILQKESSMIQPGPDKGPFFWEISLRMDLNSFCINLRPPVGAH